MILFFNKNRIVYEYEGPIRVIRKHTLNSWEIVLLAFVFLISASLIYPSISNPLIGIFIGLPLITGISYILLKRFDSFSFILIILVCNHFRFYENFWNLFFLGSFLIFNAKEIIIKRRNNIFLFLFKGLFIFNFISLLLNDNGMFTDIIIGFAVFCSFLLIFYHLINYNFQEYDWKRLFHVVSFIIFFEFIISIFQKTGIIGINLPYLPLRLSFEDILINLSVSRVPGTFGDFELLAEYAAFLMIFLMSLLLYRKIGLLVSKRVLILSLISVFILILLTGTRSSIFIIGFAVLILFLMHLKLLFSLRLWLGTTVIVFAMLFMISKGDPLGLEVVFDRISDMDLNLNDKQSTDQLINRDVTFDYAYNRLDERSWIIGNGYTNGPSYKKSLFGDVDSIVGDYHSLYLSMPIFFGWIGSSFFILLIIAELTLYLNNLLHSKIGSISYYISLGLLLTWFMLFVNEYKIQFIRYPNYFFLIWFWMAISLNISKKIQNENNYAR